MIKVYIRVSVLQCSKCTFKTINVKLYYLLSLGDQSLGKDGESLMMVVGVGGGECNSFVLKECDTVKVDIKLCPRVTIDLDR